MPAQRPASLFSGSSAARRVDEAHTVQLCQIAASWFPSVSGRLPVYLGWAAGREPRPASAVPTSRRGPAPSCHGSGPLSELGLWAGPGTQGQAPTKAHALGSESLGTQCEAAGPRAGVRWAGNPSQGLLGVRCICAALSLGAKQSGTLHHLPFAFARQSFSALAVCKSSALLRTEPRSKG